MVCICWVQKIVDCQKDADLHGQLPKCNPVQLSNIRSIPQWEDRKIPDLLSSAGIRESLPSLSLTCFFVW